MKVKIFLCITILFFIGSSIFVVIHKFGGVSILRPLAGQNMTLILISELNSKGISIKETPYEDENSLVASISGSRVYFSKEKDLSSQAQALQIILGKTTIDGKIPKEIDLRYAKPILRY